MPLRVSGVPPDLVVTDDQSAPESIPQTIQHPVNARRIGVVDEVDLHGGLIRRQGFRHKFRSQGRAANADGENVGKAFRLGRLDGACVDLVYKTLRCRSES